MVKFVKKIFSKPKLSFIMGIILGITFTASGVYAASSLTSKSVFYDSKNSSLSSTNVQDALDELYENGKSCFPHYAFGLPTDSSPTDFKEVIASSGSSTFVRKQGDQLSVCLYSNATNNKLVCLKNGVENYEANKAILNTTNFPGARCSAYSSYAICESESFLCRANLDGYVICADSDADLVCDVDSDGEVGCV